MNIKGTDCEQCGGEIGDESYVICLDGITNKQVTFHKRCQPQMSDVQQHHHLSLAPGVFDFKGKDLG